MNLTTDDLRGMIAAINEEITVNQDELNQLDAAVGDGDHGTGISTGFQATTEPLQQATSPADVMKITASTLMNRMGGSSGALYGTLFLRAALHVKDQDTLSPEVFAEMWQAGRDGVMQRGKSQVGDKTMIDALTPAVDTLKQAVGAGESLLDALKSAAQAAEDGRQKTAEMTAKHGRARYVGERSIGYIDAGATSISLMFQAIYEYWKEKQHGET
jgi:phosphoenolpyruvate---glycerone phosphotransferase subunit DhaL